MQKLLLLLVALAGCGALRGARAHIEGITLVVTATTKAPSSISR